MLCFEFSAESVLITHQSFSYSWTVFLGVRFSFFLPALRVGWGLSRTWEGTDQEQQTWTGQRGNPFHIVLSLAIVAVEESFQRGHCSETDFAFVCCGWQSVAAFALPACSLIKLCLWLQAFLTFAFLVLSPSSWSRGGVESECLLAGWGQLCYTLKHK